MYYRKYFLEQFNLFTEHVTHCNSELPLLLWTFFYFLMSIFFFYWCIKQATSRKEVRERRRRRGGWWGVDVPKSVRRRARRSSTLTERSKSVSVEGEEKDFPKTSIGNPRWSVFQLQVYLAARRRRIEEICGYWLKWKEIGERKWILKRVGGSR